MELIPSLWIRKHQIKTSAGLPFEFKDHHFMVDFLNDMSPLICLLKPPQIGATETIIVKTFYCADKKGWDIIYTLPTASDVNDMAGGKINRIVAQNEVLSNLVKDHNTVEQKAVGDHIIYYRGTYSQKQAMMVSSDLNVHDEVDACYEPDTEVLTKRGWVKIQDIILDDKVCTLNQKNHIVVWQYPTDVFNCEYNDNLYRFTANSIDIAVTKNHKMYARTSSKSGFQGKANKHTLHYAPELVDKSFVMTSRGCWNYCDKDDGFTTIPSCQTKKNYKNVYYPAKKVNKLAFYEFLGWYLTEGSVHKVRTSKGRQKSDGNIVITQKANYETNLIIDCVKRLGYEPRVNTNKRDIHSIIIKDKQLALFLQSLGYCNSKYLPDRYLYTRKKYLKAFLDAAILGDGDDRNVITTQSKRLSDNYQIIALQLGLSASIYYEPKAKVYRVGIIKHPYRRFNGFRNSNSRGTVNIEEYKGKVYCITVPNSVIMVRGKNKKIPLWCGNSDPRVIEQYETRLQAKANGRRWYFSHPSATDMGIDIYWQQSDQKHWFITCPHCGEVQYLDWPDSIDMVKRCYICKKCKGELSDDDRRNGKWIAKYSKEWQENNVIKPFSGYWISQLMCPWIKAEKIIDDFNTKSPEYFYNYVLGLPYSGGDSKLTKQQLLQNLTGHLEQALPDERIVIGIDTGPKIDYVLGNQRLGLYYHGEDDGYKGLNAIMMQFPKAIAIIDAGGDYIGAQEFFERFRGRVFMCYTNTRFSGNEIWKWDDDKGQVNADRERTIQLVVDEFRNMRLPLQGDENDWYEYWLDWKNLSRIKVFDPKTNQPKGIKWVRNGRDHRAMATVYWRIGIDRFSEEKSTFIEPNRQTFNGMMA